MARERDEIKFVDRTSAVAAGADRHVLVPTVFPIPQEAQIPHGMCWSHEVTAEEIRLSLAALSNGKHKLDGWDHTFPGFDAARFCCSVGSLARSNSQRALSGRSALISFHPLCKTVC